MTFSVQTERDKVVLPIGAKEDEAVNPPAPPIATELVESSFDPRSVNEQLRQIRDAVKTEPNLLAIAKILGCSYCIGDVSTTEDTRFVHDLGRLPVLILFSIDLGGLTGVVHGVPEGAVGTNETPWTQSAIYVRASRAARYAFFLM